MSNLIKITMVGTGAKSEKPYARDILGRTFFPQNQDTELKVGMYAYFIESLQTKGTDPTTGDLVDLLVPVKNNIITATFADKAEAVATLVELQTVGMDVAAAVANQAKELKLDDATVAKLAQAAW